MSSKWGDDDENKEDESPKVLVSESTVDENGIKTVTSFTTNSAGQQIKTVTKIKVTSKPMRMNKQVLDRRSNFVKFGAVANQGSGAEKNVTYLHYDNIVLNLRRKERGEDDEKDDPLNKISSGGKEGSIVVCRYCGESGHWTLKCPKRDKIAPKGMSATAADTSVAQVRATRSDGKYVAPGRRGGKGERMGGGSRFDDEVPALRVSDISEDTSEDDLRMLFGRYGHLTRVYLVKDRQTGIPKGVAFINFALQESAEKAIAALDGHRWDHLILRVEFAKRREEKPMSEKERTQYILSRQKRQF